MYDELAEAEKISCMVCDLKKKTSPDEELALFMQRFNLDRDTVETMPAFELHCKVLFPRDVEEENTV